MLDGHFNLEYFTLLRKRTERKHTMQGCACELTLKWNRTGRGALEKENGMREQNV